MYASSRTDGKNSWVGESQPNLGPAFSKPVVVGQVMSANDDAWSVFWSRGSSKNDRPDPTNFYTGMHIGEDSDTTRASETIGYIVIDATHGTASGVDYEGGITPDTVRGYDNSFSYSANYDEAFSSTPEVVIVTQVAMDGGDGGWAVLSGSQSASALACVIDEDQISNSERKHTTEEVAYISFGTEGSLDLSTP